MKKQKIVRIIITLMIALSWKSSTPAQADTSYVCSGDSTQVCPSVSMIHFTSNATGATDHSTGSGNVYAHKKSTTLNFSYSSQNIDANKLITIQFFNITPGLKILVVPTKGFSTVCNPQLVIQKECQTRLDASGDAHFSLALFDVEPGAGFNYQLVGATAWVSNFVRVIFTDTGNAPDAPMTCAAQSSQVCAPVTALSVLSNGRAVKQTYSSSGDGTMTIGVDTQYLLYRFTSTSGYAYKTVYVDFFGISPANLLSIDTSANAQGVGCDKQVAVANGCFIQLDSKGSASFIVSFAPLTADATYKFKINGASYTSKFVTVKVAQDTVFSTATPSISPLISAKGGKGVLEITIRQGNGQTALISGTGIRTTTVKISSNSANLFLTAKPGKHLISVKIGNVTKKMSVRTT